MRIALTVLIPFFCNCLCGCQFSGGTALPPLPGLDVKTPSGYHIKADSNLKGSLVFKDGDGKEITVKLQQDVEGVVTAQGQLAQGLEGLAKVDAQKHKATLEFLAPIRDLLMARLLPIPGTPVNGTGTVPFVEP